MGKVTTLLSRPHVPLPKTSARSMLEAPHRKLMGKRGLDGGMLAATLLDRELRGIFGSYGQWDGHILRISVRLLRRVHSAYLYISGAFNTPYLRTFQCALYPIALLCVDHRNWYIPRPPGNHLHVGE